MNILAFDTCFAACSVAAARALGPDEASSGQDVASDFKAMATGHAEQLPLMIRAVMDRAGLAFSDLDRIAVTTGPGTFTGTRIAVAAARALALSAPRCALVPVSSLAVMAASPALAQVMSSRQGRNCATTDTSLMIAVDARREEVYVQLFEAGGANAVTGPLLLPVAEAAALGGAGGLLVAGSAAFPVADAAQKAGRHASAHLPELLPDARDLCRLAATMQPARDAIRPLYMRPADAKPQTGKSIERVAS